MKWAVIVAALALPQASAAQLAVRLADTEDGVVRFSYPTRAEVEVCDQGVRIGERHMWWQSRGRYDEPRNCRYGSAEVELRVARGLVRDVSLVRDPGETTADALDFGEVAAADAARFLLSLSYEGATHDAAEDGILPAMLADAEDTWRDLVVMARDRGLDVGVRKNALFWLGQEAANAATDGIAAVALDDSEDQDIRNSAIFALSQRPADEGIPILMEVARDGDQAETRRTAMFWLAQSEDERVVDFFEEILLHRNRR